MNTASILIVEDEAIIAADLERQLKQLGYQVVGSIDRGEDAIALARSQRPSLVMMDIRLAGAMDGIEAAMTIHRETALPVVFLTAHCDKATLERAQLAAAFGYILKPFETRDLQVQIEMALHKHAAWRLLVAEKARLEGQIEMIEHTLDRTQKELRGLAANLSAATQPALSAAGSEPQSREGLPAGSVTYQAPAAQLSAVTMAELTPRQRQVLQLVAKGDAGKEIASRLGISPKTVEYHKAALMKQLGMHTTAELTRYAIKHGLITVD